MFNAGFVRYGWSTPIMVTVPHARQPTTPSILLSLTLSLRNAAARSWRSSKVTMKIRDDLLLKKCFLSGIAQMTCPKENIFYRRSSLMAIATLITAWTYHLIVYVTSDLGEKYCIAQCWQHWIIRWCLNVVNTLLMLEWLYKQGEWPSVQDSVRYKLRGPCGDPVQTWLRLQVQNGLQDWLQKVFIKMWANFIFHI